MARHNIEQFDIFYALLKGYVKICFRVFYRKIEVNGYKENVPKDVPIIFASNHQNALIDAFAVLFTTPGHTVYMARSDIFENPTNNKILTFLKILPIFRIRDGIKNLSRNQEIFEKTVDILHKNKRLAILPEGNHAGFRKLRALKKGIARITFQSAEKANYDMPIHIVPVGLEYGNYVNMRSTLFVNYGKPLDASIYYEDYKENPQRTMTNMLKDLRGRMSELMIDIQDDEHYKLIENVREIYRDEMKKKLNLNGVSLVSNFTADKALVGHFENVEKSTFDELREKINQYKESLKKLKLRDWVLNKKHNFLVVLLQLVFGIALLPAHIFGMIFNYIPYKFPVWFTNKNIKDVMFYSSFRFVLSSLIVPIFYIIFFLIFGFVYEFNIWSVIFLIAMPICGFITIWNYLFLKKRIAQLRFIFGKFFHNKKLISTIQLRKDIISIIDKSIVGN